MRGAKFVGDRCVVLREVPDPQPKDDWVVVRPKASTLCGTDLPFYRSEREALGDCIPGHEIAGEVVAVDRALHVRPGDRVVLNTQVGCGHCRFCRAGSVLFCPEMQTAGLGEGLHGGHADYVLIPEKDCLPLPEDISYTVGSVIPDGVGVPYHLLRRMGGTSGLEKIAVFGAGPIGLGMVAMLKHMGAGMILVSEPIAYRRQLAQKLGADRIIDPQTEDPIDVIHDLTNGVGVDKTIDAASYTDVTVNQALVSVKKGGTVGLVGQKDLATIQDYIHELIHKELYLVSSCGYNLSEYESLVEAVRSGVDVKGFITHTYPLEEIQSAFQMFDSGNTGKVVIVRE